VSDPTIAFWGPPLLPEEAALVDEYLADGRPQDERASVYVLALEDGAVYCGLTKDISRRLAEHRRAQETYRLPVGSDACPAEGSPGTFYLALHGEPALIAVVACPSRRHAHLYEALLTDKIGEAGINVYGARWDQTVASWGGRNERKGAKLDGADALDALIAR
jgi:hypothetical protein